MDLLTGLRSQSGRAVVAAALAIFFLVSAHAQTSRGTVTGLVTDPSGAAIANAEVELTNQQTNVKRSTQSNASGFYRFDAVDPGEYTVAVRMMGFSTAVQRAIPVLAGQSHAIDVRLEVGETATVIEVVEAAGAVLQVESALRGGNISTTQATELPFSGRNPVSLALTLPGVSSNRYGFGVGTFPVNGSRGRSNNFLIDGVDNNDTGVAGQGLQIRIPDALQEVSVQTSNFDAEYGRAGGAVVNAITKSGTNDFHGSLFYLFDVTNDDAITNTQSLDPEIVKRGKPPQGTEQWYGLSLGGPILRNRTFFFGAWGDQRQRATATTTRQVPSAAGWATLNSVFPAGRSQNIDLYRSVASTMTATSQFFPVALADGRPAVEFGTASLQYPLGLFNRQWLVKVDHQLTQNDQLSGRYTDDGGNDIATTNFPGFHTDQVTENKNAIVSYTRVFSPSVTNELRVGYSRIVYEFPLNQENELGNTLPRYTIAGIATNSHIGIQTNMPQGRRAHLYNLQDTANWIRGTHSFRFGVDLQNQRGRDAAPFRTRGELTYQASTGYTGFANFADDFSGTNGGTWRDFGSPVNYPRTFRQAYFFQDRWRATSSLTLTLGIRYDYFGVPMNALPYPVYGGLFNVDPATLNGPWNMPSEVKADKNNWSPVVGLAYSPNISGGVLGWLFGEKRTVIRTGYQISYDMFFNNILSNAATSSPNLISTQIQFPTTAANPRGQANISQQFPAVAAVPRPSDTQVLVPEDLVSPYMQKWSFGIQRELPSNVLVDVSYVGSKGTRLFVNEDSNPLVPASMRITPAGPINSRASLTNRLDNLQGYRLTRTNGGDSNYHSFQSHVIRRFANGFQMSAAYTWSKLIDNGSEVFGVAATGTPQNTQLPAMFGGLTADRAVSLFDRTHRAVLTYVYELPFMRQQQGVLGRVIGGWQLSGWTTFESGPPLNVSNGVDSDGIGSNFDRPNINPAGQAGVRAQPSATSPTGYVNPDVLGADGRYTNQPIDPTTARYIGNPAFSGTTPGPTGTAGRHTERMPGINNFDVRLTKKVRVTERVSTAFQAEFYNVFNHPQYGSPSVSPFSPGQQGISQSVMTSPAGRFLQPQYADAGGRVIRYQLRIEF
jgi:outer membrane receptor protein involved in Fe transport